MSEWALALADYDAALDAAAAGGFKADPYILNSRGNVLVSVDAGLTPSLQRRGCAAWAAAASASADGAAPSSVRKPAGEPRAVGAGTRELPAERGDLPGQQGVQARDTRQPIKQPTRSASGASSFIYACGACVHLLHPLPRPRRKGVSTTQRLDGAIYASANAALMRAQLGDDAGALRDAEGIARRAPNSADMRAAVAALLWGMGRTEEAEDAWQARAAAPGGANHMLRRACVGALAPPCHKR